MVHNIYPIAVVYVKTNLVMQEVEKMWGICADFWGLCVISMPDSFLFGNTELYNSEHV